MGPSQRELILAQAKASLEKAGVPPGLTFHRHRTRRLEEDALPAGVIFNGVETITRQTSAPPIIERDLLFRVELRADGEPSDQVLDPYLSWVERQLTTDEDFLALVRRVEIRQVVWDQAPAKRAKAAAAMEFSVSYRTRWGDPTEVP